MRTFLLSSLLSVLALSLSFDGSTAYAGGSSDGTGNFFTASEQEIVDAVMPAALKVMMAPFDFRESPFTGKKEFGKILPVDLQFFATSELSTATTLYFERNPEGSKQPFANIEFLKTGPCEGPDGATGAGSINTVNGKPRLCLSLEKLTAIPVDYLENELASLLAHETAHVLGKDEATAQSLQRWFANYQKIRDDVVGFVGFIDQDHPGDGYILRVQLMGLPTLSREQICTMKEMKTLEVDRAIRRLRLKIGFPGLEWTDPNTVGYWGRLVGTVRARACNVTVPPEELKKSITELQTKYETFITQFGWILPMENYR